MTIQPSPDQTGGFQPDWDELARVVYNSIDVVWPGDEDEVGFIARTVVEALWSQQAAQGYVTVRRRDLAIDLGVEGAHNTMDYDDAIARLHTALTPAQEQPKPDNAAIEREIQKQLRHRNDGPLY
jgi:hypothetical protein